MRAFVALGSVLLLSVQCNGPGTESPRRAYIEVTPANMTLKIGEIQEATARVMNYGHTPPTIVWFYVGSAISMSHTQPLSQMSGNVIRLCGGSAGIDTIRATLSISEVDDGYLIVTVVETD